MENTEANASTLKTLCKTTDGHTQCPSQKNNKTMSKMNENVWQTILKIVIAVASAILGGLGAAAARLMN